MLAACPKSLEYILKCDQLMSSSYDQFMASDGNDADINNVSESFVKKITEENFDTHDVKNDKKERKENRQMQGRIENKETISTVSQNKSIKFRVGLMKKVKSSFKRMVLRGKVHNGERIKNKHVLAQDKSFCDEKNVDIGYELNRPCNKEEIRDDGGCQNITDLYNGPSLVDASLEGPMVENEVVPRVVDDQDKSLNVQNNLDHDYDRKERSHNMMEMMKDQYHSIVGAFFGSSPNLPHIGKEESTACNHVSTTDNLSHPKVQQCPAAFDLHKEYPCNSGNNDLARRARVALAGIFDQIDNILKKCKGETRGQDNKSKDDRSYGVKDTDPNKTTYSEQTVIFLERWFNYVPFSESAS
uniref:Uncharacterized protein n=1 Tax=Corethron hystrix TaxID=216773 RepID=A0A7S1BS37_9STRA